MADRQSRTPPRATDDPAVRAGTPGNAGNTPETTLKKDNPPRDRGSADGNTHGRMEHRESEIGAVESAGSIRNSREEGGGLA